MEARRTLAIKLSLIYNSYCFDNQHYHHCWWSVETRKQTLTDIDSYSLHVVIQRHWRLMFAWKEREDIPWVTSGFVLIFIMVGMLGPYTSASSKPTLSWHFLASATAKLTVNSIQSSNGTPLIQIKRHSKPND